MTRRLFFVLPPSLLLWGCGWLGGGEVAVTVHVQSEAGQPLGLAQVEVRQGARAWGTTTDAQGEAALTVERHVSVDVTVTRAGYHAYHDVWPADMDSRWVVTLGFL